MNFSLNKPAGVDIYFNYLDTPCDDFIKNYYTKEVFQGKKGEIYSALDLDQPRVYLGLGSFEGMTYNRLRDALASLAHFLCQRKIDSINLKFEKFEGMCTRRTTLAYVEGLRSCEYKFDKYLQEKHTWSLKNVNINVEDDKLDTLTSALQEGNTLVDSIFLTRDYVNTPAMDLYPSVYAESVKETLEKDGVTVHIYALEDIQKLGMKAFLSVAQGSDKEPKLLVMEYKGNPSSNKTIAYVGKGLTYDSGGYCIKSPKGMVTMQSDMGGSATVVGALSAIAREKLPINVVGVCALCENLISGSAYKTGDIIGSMKGLSIEVGNTDAEGRLTLADALYYAVKTYKPDFVIDLATLTGACIVALGDLAAGLVTNNDDLYEKVLRASTISDEQVWQLPNLEGYQEYIKSDVADVKNTNTIPGAGTITAGLFLEKFVEETPWVHLDIAGTAWLDRKIGALPKGGTGSHVKTLYQVAKLSSKEN